MSALERELQDRLSQLGPDEKRTLLKVAGTLSRTRERGVPGPELLALAGSLDEESAREMLEAIEESFERESASMRSPDSD